MSFKKDFVWGVATASYQIEGGAHAADKGLNGWDVGSATHGRIFEGHSGDVGCDHYHKFREDVALMKKFGVKAYRFSVNWARLIPQGEGKLSEDGKRFYLELLSALREAGIEPWVTLFHWDYPYALYLRGGWLNPESPKWFANYAAQVATLFKPYVGRYILINEPQCFLGLGHSSGEHAPFLKLPDGEVMRAAHNVLLGCGLAEKRIREIAGDVKIGTAQAYWPCLPKEEGDVGLAREETFACRRNFGSVHYYTDPLIFGRYPEEFGRWQRESGFSYPESDMAVIRSKLDFYGLNTYSGDYVTRGEHGEAVRVLPSPSVPKTDMRWNVYPDSLYYGPKFVFERYGLPIVYTENGVALTEWKDLNGEINDDSRIDFLKRYLRALHRAAEEIEVDGYFYWSFLDNFEWAEGFSKKFGLVHVDYDTLERTPKKSAYFYKKIAETNGEAIFQ